MKDMVMSRRTILNSFREGLIQNHPKVFNVFLIFALISLVVTGAFLLSDIMSFNSNAVQKEHFSGLYQKIPREIQITIKNWQEESTKLIDQCKSVLGLMGPDNAATKNASNKDKVRPLLAKNRLAKAKEAHKMGGNLSHLQNLKSPSNSSRTQTEVHPAQVIRPTLIGSTESEGDSDTPSYSLKDGSTKINTRRFEAVKSNFSQNRLQSNETVLEESVPNESIMNETDLDGQVLNKSQINQSQRYTNLSSNISENLPITNLGSNDTRNSSYSFVPRSTDVSIDNRSSGSLSFPRPQMNFADTNSTEVHQGLPPDKNDSGVSDVYELNHKNNETHYQNEAPNLNANDNNTREKETKNKSLTIMPDHRNIASDASGSWSNKISANSVPDNSSNITSHQINISLESRINPAPTREIIFANNSSFKSQEPKQNQTNNRIESEQTLARSSLSLSPTPNDKTEGVQNHAGTNSKKISSSSGSARSQESRKSQMNNVNRFRSLKVPTPSWMTKAGSMNKIRGIK